MISPDVMKLAAIKALIEAMEDASDAKDAVTAMEIIRGLVAKTEK